MHRNVSSTHLGPLQHEEKRDDADENDAEQLEIVQERQHGGLALDHAVDQSLSTSGGIGGRRRPKPESLP